MHLGGHDSVHAEASGGSGMGGVTPDGALGVEPEGQLSRTTSVTSRPPARLTHPVRPVGSRAHALMAARPTSVLKVKFGDSDVETGRNHQENRLVAMTLLSGENLVPQGRAWLPPPVPSERGFFLLD